MPERLARWLATCPNGTWQPRGTGTVWVPYSMPHAREVGASLTACGRFAVGWELFWDLPFRPEATDVCQECAEALKDSHSSAKTGHRKGDV
jgi:hypothetical protein